MLTFRVAQQTPSLANRVRSRKMAPALRYSASLYHRSVALEFRREAGFTPSGALRPWKKTQKFGTIEPPKKTLQREGKLIRAATGTGAGALLQVTERQFIVGISSQVVPYAAVHRGGSTQAVTSTPAIIRPKKRVRVQEKGRSKGRFKKSIMPWAMGWKILSIAGFMPSRAKMRTGFVLPRRTFGRITNALRTEIARVLANYMLTGTFARSNFAR